MQDCPNEYCESGMVYISNCVEVCPICSGVGRVEIPDLVEMIGGHAA